MKKTNYSYLPQKCTILWLGILVFIISNCAPTLKIQQNGDSKMRKVISETKFLSDQFSGLCLFDPIKKEYIYQLRSDRYFTPASNTKIFTFLSALTYLQDSLVAYEFAETNDAVYIKGAGDPTLFHPEFKEYQKAFPLQPDSNKSVYYIDNQFKDDRYGSGWAWSDYLYGYQVEKSPMPIFANRLTVKMDQGKLEVIPNYYQSYFENDPDKGWAVFRDECSNSFYYNENKLEGKQYSLPFIYSPYDHAKLLSAEWALEINPIYGALPQNLVFEKIKQTPIDTVYRKYMQQSDNFIAEQLLLIISQQELGYMNSDSAISFLKKNIWEYAPNELQWYDGSGLSRYNLFTPKTVVFALDNILTEIGAKGVKAIFPNGGKSGTIKNWYKGEEVPYVFAKTGTLKNNHCLSGFIETNSGRLLIFSMMNNNYFGGSSKSKEKMQTILEFIRDHY